MAWWHNRYSATPEKRDEIVEALRTTNLVIKGDEPFLTFNNARVIVNFTDYSRRSHNFEWPHTDFEKPWSTLKTGDTLRIQFSKVTAVKFPWYKKLLLKLVEKL
jgi:hypothetical protein